MSSVTPHNAWWKIKVVVTVIWSIIVVLIAGSNYDQAIFFCIQVLVFTSPCWFYWTGVWIWGEGWIKKGFNLNKKLKVLYITLGALVAFGLFKAVNFSDTKNYCNRYFTLYEQKYQIPAKLLEAIAVVEANVQDKAAYSVVPRQWSVASRGINYHFESKKEAMHTVRKMILAGESSINVSCMQINLETHTDAFPNLEQAMDADHNIAYAASFLRGNFDKQHSWKNAVALYHSNTPELGSLYAKKVLAAWVKLSTQKEMDKYISTEKTDPAVRK